MTFHQAIKEIMGFISQYEFGDKFGDLTPDEIRLSCAQESKNWQSNDDLIYNGEIFLEEYVSNAKVFFKDWHQKKIRESLFGKEGEF